MPKNGIKSDIAWLYYGVACDRVQAICVRIYMQFVTCCVLLFFTTEKKIYRPKKKCWNRLWEHKKKKKKTQTFEQLIICKATKKFCVRCSIISCRLRFSVIRRLQSHIRNIAANLMDTLIIFKRLNIWVYMIYNGDYLFVVSLKNRLVSHNKIAVQISHRVPPYMGPNHQWWW